MAQLAGNGRPTAGSGLRDFLVLGVRALASGVAVAVTLGFAALVLAHNAQAAGAAKVTGAARAAASGDGAAIYDSDPVAVAAAAPAFRETLLVSAQRDNEPGSAAPAPDGPTRPRRAGALWARREAQADNAATLLLAGGLLALGALCLVAVIGRGARGTRT